MNTYPGYHGFRELDRRSRLESSAVIGYAIGSMITATVLGLPRAVDEMSSGTRRRGGASSANDDSMKDASGWS